MASQFSNNGLLLCRDVLGLKVSRPRLRPKGISCELLQEVLPVSGNECLLGNVTSLGALVNLFLVGGNECDLELNASGQHHVMGRDERAIGLAAEGDGVAIEFDECSARFLGRTFFVDARGLADAVARAGGLMREQCGRE